MQELLQGGVQKLEQHPDNWLHTPDCKVYEEKKVCCVQMQELLQGGVQKLEQHPDNWLHTPDCKVYEK